MTESELLDEEEARGREIFELRDRIEALEVEVRRLRQHLAPVDNKITGLKWEIAGTHRHRATIDGPQVLGFAGPVVTVTSSRINGTVVTVDGARAFTYGEVAAVVVIADPAAIERRKPLFDELVRLAEIHGPTRSRLTLLKAELKGLKAALERIQLMALRPEKQHRPAKPAKPAKKQPDLFEEDDGT